MENLYIVALFEDDDHNDQINMLHLMLNELMKPELDKLEVRQHSKRPRNFNYYEIIVPQYDNVLFKEHF